LRVNIDVGAVPSDPAMGVRLRWDLERDEPPAE
jgi:hypothetical protein